MKKFLAFILTLCALLSLCTAFTTAEELVTCQAAGDANSDGKINLGDVSLMLKYVAKWTGLTIDLDQADSVNDGKINLSDASALLKHIAKWNTVRLGHNDIVKVESTVSCKNDGVTTLTCKVCGNVERIIADRLSCKYERTVISVANCGSAGSVRYTCSMCGDSYTETSPATGNHSYGSDSCTVCGRPKPSTDVLKFSLTSDGTAYVCDGYNTWKHSDILVIPDYYNGKPVIGISKGAFLSATNGPKEVYLPETLQYIKYMAFKNARISTITIPASVTEIDGLAFSGCGSLETAYFSSTGWNVDALNSGDPYAAANTLRNGSKTLSRN